MYEKDNGKKSSIMSTVVKIEPTEFILIGSLAISTKWVITQSEGKGPILVSSNAR